MKLDNVGSMTYEIVAWDRFANVKTVSNTDNLTDALKKAYEMRKSFKSDNAGHVTVLFNGVKHGEIAYNPNIYMMDGKKSVKSPCGIVKYQIYPNGTLKKL